MQQNFSRACVAHFVLRRPPDRQTVQYHADPEAHGLFEWRFKRARLRIRCASYMCSDSEPLLLELGKVLISHLTLRFYVAQSTTTLKGVFMISLLMGRQITCNPTNNPRLPEILLASLEER